VPARSVASLVLLVFALPAFTSCGVLLGAAGQLASDREDDAGRTVSQKATPEGDWPARGHLTYEKASTRR
jgi:hypothetical protein